MNKLLKECMDEFHFGKVEKVMQHLNWKWVVKGIGVPTVDQMKEMVHGLYKSCKECATEARRMDDKWIGPAVTGSGGFEVEVGLNKKGKTDYVLIRFCVDSWSSYE